MGVLRPSRNEGMEHHPPECLLSLRVNENKDANDVDWRKKGGRRVTTGLPLQKTTTSLRRRQALHCFRLIQ